MARIVLLYYGYGISADGIVKSLTDGRDQIHAVLLIIIADELHQHLRISSTPKLISLFYKLFLQNLIVLDDAIMH